MERILLDQVPDIEREEQQQQRPESIVHPDAPGVIHAADLLNVLVRVIATERLEQNL
ncbi:hypothetical protein D3C75_972220 [compost metagenome]